MKWRKEPTRQGLTKGGMRLTNQTSLHSWLERGYRAVGDRLVLARSSLAVSPVPPPQQLRGWEVLDVGRVLQCSDSVVGSRPSLFLFQKIASRRCQQSPLSPLGQLVARTLAGQRLRWRVGSSLMGSQPPSGLFFAAQPPRGYSKLYVCLGVLISVLGILNCLPILGLFRVRSPL